MHFATIFGLALAVTGALAGNTYQAHTYSAGVGLQAYSTGSAALYSVASQATTSTVTTQLTPTVAATSAVRATATITQATPVPIPTQVASGGNLRINPFDASFLFSAPRPAMGPLAWAFLVLMLLLLAASIYFYAIKRRQWKRTNSVNYRAANTWAQVGLWVSIISLLFLLTRAVGLDFFNMRFWLYLCLLATLVAAGWFVYWLRTTYPKEMEKFNKRQRARQYMPGKGKPASGPSTPVAQKGKGQPRATAGAQPASGKQATSPTNLGNKQPKKR
jgi:hypothetical protein